MKCFTCNSDLSATVYPYNDFAWNQSSIFTNLELYHCENCGLGFAYPDVTLEDLGYYYSQIYRAKNSPFYFDFSLDVNKRMKRSYQYGESRPFAQVLMARFFTEFNANDVFLDIGPGKGGSFELANLLLPNPRLYGIELTEGAPEFFKRNFNADTYGSLGMFINSGNKAKILLMSHSLEHYRLADLTPLFTEIKQALDKNGILVIEVPHCDLRIHAEVRNNDTPHLLFFSKEGLRQLLIKFGFEILFLDTFGEKIRTVEENEKLKASVANALKRRFRNTYNKFPKSLQNGIRIIVRNFYKVKHARLLSEKYYDSLPLHTYGGNRNCLRLVARIKD